MQVPCALTDDAALIVTSGTPHAVLWAPSSIAGHWGLGTGVCAAAPTALSLAASLRTQNSPVAPAECGSWQPATRLSHGTCWGCLEPGDPTESMNMRHVLRTGLLALGLVIGSVTPATAQVSIGIGLPGVSIGINLPVYPQLVRGAGLPGLLRAASEFELLLLRRHVLGLPGDNWYASSWYNGPWGLVARRPCRCSSCASRCATTGARRRTSTDGGPTRRRVGASTGATTGSSIEADGTSGIATPRRRRAPLPTYQRQYSGNRYPHGGAAARTAGSELPLPAA